MAKKTTETKKSTTAKSVKSATTAKSAKSAPVKSVATTKTAQKANSGKFWPYIVKPFLFLALCGVIGFQQYQIRNMQHDLANAQKVYVYDLEEVLRGIKLDDLNREFEAKISILNNEVTSAQDKISSLKNSKVKDDFSDVYLKSLKLKRDTMVQEYSRTLQNITDEINNKVTELAQENGASAVFDKRFIAASTPAVIDLTTEIVNRAKLTRPHILDE